MLDSVIKMMISPRPAALPSPVYGDAELSLYVI